MHETVNECYGLARTRTINVPRLGNAIFGYHDSRAPRTFMIFYAAENSEPLLLLMNEIDAIWQVIVFLKQIGTSNGALGALAVPAKRNWLRHLLVC